ncbi:hypothetical protein M902_0594 [Bacteriovorax sp. BAL6_X]|uniref:hypothetical protein n=1 Tax=Bacteriovorax sp. BAL6_X TaxID=1201290 RepID=UPI000385D6A2|nr:hypothetical protein [Bacteriovorax sp. BAL6_X]EPZ49971.1 hypothetical protein M902_0594 [Bacteriovorax sp. BAL6_X]
MKYFLFLAVLVQSFSFAFSHESTLNNELKSLFNGFKEDIIFNINKEIKENFNNKEIGSNLKLMSANITKTNILDFPIEFYEIADSKIVVGIPESNKWKLKLRARLRYETKWFRMTKLIKLNIKELKFKYVINYDRDENSVIRVKSIDTIDKKLRIDLKASNVLINGLLAVAKKVLKKKINKSFDKLLLQGSEQLKTVFDLNERFRQATPERLKSPPRYSFSDLEDTIENIEDKIAQKHMINGTVLNLRYNKNDYISWFDAYGPDGQGTQGEVIGFGTFSDAAIWNGAYLASQAFRYRVSQNEKALNNIRRNLEGIGNLLGVNGFTGLLSRSAQPLNSMAGRALMKDRDPLDYEIVDYKGEKWVNHHEKKGITRDQYTGIIFGLTITYDLIEDEEIKTKAASYYRMMLDYLIRNNWTISEDREISITPSKVIAPTVWFGSPEQQLNMLVIGEHMFPGQYTQELNRMSELSKTAYIFHNITAKDNVNKYYKFNLLNMHFYNYFRLEKDQERRADMLRSYKVIKYSTGHHDNSFFNLIEYSFNPEAVSEEKITRIQENLVRFLERSPRNVSIVKPPLEDIELVQYPEYGGKGFMSISADALDIRHRHAGGSFMWQREPYTVGYEKRGAASDENPGYDITLIYWMSKYYGL